MNDEAKVIAVIGVIVLFVFGGFVFMVTKGKSGNPTTTTAAKVDSSLLVRADSHQTNPKGAPVTIVEFGDYQCPSCGVAHPIIKQILKDYPGKVNFVFRNFPLTQHPNALPATEAVEAAGEQGKYWEMHDKLYENQNAWSTQANPLDIFAGYAKDLGLNVDKFKQEVNDKKFNNFIQKDLGDGNLIAIDATPTFFINGEKIVGVPNAQDLKSTIDAILAAVPATATPSASPKAKK